MHVKALGGAVWHAAALDRVIRIPARNATLAEQLRPMLSTLLGAIEHLPTEAAGGDPYFLPNAWEHLEEVPASP